MYDRFDKPTLIRYVYENKRLSIIQRRNVLHTCMNYMT